MPDFQPYFLTEFYHGFTNKISTEIKDIGAHSAEGQSRSMDDLSGNGNIKIGGSRGAPRISSLSKSKSPSIGSNSNLTEYSSSLSSSQPATTATSTTELLLKRKFKASSHFQFSSIDCHENTVLVGTSEGVLIRFKLMDDSQFQIWDTQTVGSKSIQHIRIIPSLSIIMVVQDSNLTFHDFHSLQLIPGLNKSPNFISTCPYFHVYHDSSISNIDQIAKSDSSNSQNKNRNNSVKIYFGKRRNIVCCILDRENFVVMKELPWNSTITNMVATNSIVFFSDSESYHIMNTQTGDIQFVCQFDSRYMSPTMIPVHEHEILLVTSSSQISGLGVFITSSGEPTRGTVEWPAIPKRLCIQGPYIISFFKNAIMIHFLHNQQVVHTLTLPPSCSDWTCQQSLTFEIEWLSSSFVQSAVVMNDGSILGVAMSNLKDQISNLFNSKDIREATQIGNVLIQFLVKDPQIEQQEMSFMYELAGFMKMRDLVFEDAIEFFLKANTDPRLLIALLPGAHHSSSESESSSSKNDHVFQTDTLQIDFSFVPKDSLLNDVDPQQTSSIKSIHGNFEQIIQSHLEENYPGSDQETLSSFKEAILANAFETVLSYTKRWRSQHTIQSKFLDYWLFNELVKSKDLNYLNTFLSNENHCDIGKVVSYLGTHEKWFVLAIFYRTRGELTKALEILFDLWEHDGKDPSFPGLTYITNFMKETESPAVLMPFLELLIKKKEEKSVLNIILYISSSKSATKEDLTSFCRLFEKYDSQSQEQSLRKYLDFLVGQLQMNDYLFDWIKATCQYLKQKITSRYILDLDLEYSFFSTKIHFLQFLQNRKQESDEISQTRIKLICCLQKNPNLFHSSSSHDILKDSTETSSKSTTRSITTVSSIQGDPTTIQQDADNEKIHEQKDEQESIMKQQLQNLIHSLDGMYVEQVVLNARLGNYENAIRLLVNYVKDYVSLETFACDGILYDFKYPIHEIHSFRHIMLDLLLSSKDRDKLADFIIKLMILNERQIHNSTINNLSSTTPTSTSSSFLDQIPNYWNLSIVYPYLINKIRQSQTEAFDYRLMKSLARRNRLMLEWKYAEAKAATSPFRLELDSRCDTCGRYIMDQDFVAFKVRHRKNIQSSKLTEQTIFHHAKCVLETNQS